MKFSSLRFTNIVLLALLIILGLTGAYSLFWTWQAWVFDVHRLAGMLLIAAIPWKVGIVWASLRRGGRRSFSLGVSWTLAGIGLAVIALGIAWLWRIGSGAGWLGQTVIAWHWILGLVLGLPLLVHVLQRWPKPHKVDFASRRAFLRVGLLASAGLLGWGAAGWIAALRSQPASPRRFTGSRADGDGLANVFPVTNNPGEGLQAIDLELWRLRVEPLSGEAQSYPYRELIAFPQKELEATVDCTLGWSSTHIWQGIALPSLLDTVDARGLAGIGILLASISGYAHVIPFPEAESIILATHVDGTTLDPAHGYPLRAVVPTRRGWFWVKWLQRVAVVQMAV